MDLRAYYQKIRKIEADIKDDVVVIVSRETPDGGKSGVRTDVAKGLAARMVADEKADLATPEEASQFRAEAEAKWKAANQAPTLNESEVKALRTALRPQKRT